MMRFVVCAVAALGVFAASGAAQQSRATDARFFPFVGCWRTDSLGSEGGEALNCVVPLPGSADVELVNVVDGHISGRQRIAASGRPSAIDDQGCRGEQQASWSPSARRLYLRSEFICAPNGIAGGKTTLMSILPDGERLEVEGIHSGVGSLMRVARFRDAGIPATLPRDLASRLGKQRLAVMTARADAASPLETSDVTEALRHTDSSIVRAWLTATAQHFQLSGDQVAALVRANLPASVLQAMLGTAPAYQLGVGVDASGRSADVYLNSPGTPGGGVTQMTTAAPYDNVNVYETCCTPGYSAYNYYTPVAPIAPYYPGVYSAPYGSYYSSPYPYRRYPSYYSPSRPGGGQHRAEPAPTYHSNPVGVRAGQGASNPPRQVPSRRRP
jgi:hypothetical protein